MRQLTIVSGAGINIGISKSCPEANYLLGLTYDKISKSVYNKIREDIQVLFEPDSFDFILGGLLTVNLAMEKIKGELNRFNMNKVAFDDLFNQSLIQDSIANALQQIEQSLTIPLDEVLKILKKFQRPIEKLADQYDSINYFTLNFDSVFDHMLLGPNYRRGRMCTDYWWGNRSKPELDFKPDLDARIKIFHLHGDLRYKPNKTNKMERKGGEEYRWPVIVVGDQQVKRGIIASNAALSFYNNRFKELCQPNGESRKTYKENNLAVIGFGFREEDTHIVNNIRQGITGGVFDNIHSYDMEDKLMLSGICAEHNWAKASETNLITFLDKL
jgi:hypothetical protein